MGVCILLWELIRVQTPLTSSRLPHHSVFCRDHSLCLLGDATLSRRYHPTLPSSDLNNPSGAFPQTSSTVFRALTEASSTSGRLCIAWGIRLQSTCTLRNGHLELLVACYFKSLSHTHVDQFVLDLLYYHSESKYKLQVQHPFTTQHEHWVFQFQVTDNPCSFHVPSQLFIFILAIFPCTFSVQMQDLDLNHWLSLCCHKCCLIHPIVSAVFLLRIAAFSLWSLKVSALLSYSSNLSIFSLLCRPEQCPSLCYM